MAGKERLAAAEWVAGSKGMADAVPLQSCPGTTYEAKRRMNPRPMHQETNRTTRTDVLLLVAFCGFLFFYGLGAFGLLGADEPRYAQIAREMLERSDWI